MYDDIDSEPSTTSELVREQAAYDGQFCPNIAWILSDFDTWERNPHYTGPANPRHPEDDSDYEYTDSEGAVRTATAAPSLRALGIDPQDPCLCPASDDELPF
jgi:hypothetical protein